MDRYACLSYIGSMGHRRLSFLAGAVVLAFMVASAQETLRSKDVRNLAKQGSSALPRLQELLRNPDLDIRLEAVKAITDVGTQGSLAPLIQATADNDPEVQIRATDGLVNFYLPGYVQRGLGASLKRVGTSIKGKFTDTNDQIIDPFVIPRPDVIQALEMLVRSGASTEARANAARALGILRGKAAVPDLVAALRSKDTDVIYESLIALQKIRDESAAPGVAFLLRDLDLKVQLAAVETVGLLQNKSSASQLVDVLDHSRNIKVKRAALTSLAMLGEEKSRPVFTRYLHDKDDGLRASAAEGFARLKNPADLPDVGKGVSGRRQDAAATGPGVRRKSCSAKPRSRNSARSSCSSTPSTPWLTAAWRTRTWSRWRAIRRCGRRYITPSKSELRMKKCIWRECWR